MLDTETKRRIDSARDILVGKVPDPKAQVEQITTALIYKFMDDMDRESMELGGKAKFFSDGFEQYSWTRIISNSLSGFDRLNLYSESIQKMSMNKNLPQLFRDMFKGAFLPYRDSETLNLFLKEIDGFNYDHSEKLGDAFEYLLSVLGSQGDAGQFRTPRHIIDFMVRVVNPQKNDTILDPACGTAGFLISAYKHIVKSNKAKPLTPDEKARLTSNFTGYDISPDMVKLSLVNMYLHNFPNPKIQEYDTLTSEDKWDDTFDVVLANPPFMSPKGGIRPHQRFSVKAKRSEVLFVDYIAEHLNIGGRAGIIVPEGIIFQSQNAYKELRKMLVEQHLYAVVSLPAGVFNPYAGVKTSILLMDKAIAKKSDNILFIKIENDGFDLGAQRRVIDKNDLPLAEQIINEYLTICDTTPVCKSEQLYDALKEKFPDSKIWSIATKDKIAESGDYNLSGERYLTHQEQTHYKYAQVKLSEVATINKGTINPSDAYNDWFTYIDISSVQNGTGEIDYSNRVLVVDAPSRARRTVELNDILLSTVRPNLKAFGYVDKEPNRFVASTGFAVIRTGEQLNSKFLHYLIFQDKLLSQMTNRMEKGAYPSINQKDVLELQIPLPPLEIQKEIVEEIEGYQKIIDGARQVVENYKPQIQIDPSWEMVELGEVLKIARGGSPRPINDYLTKDKNGINWIKIGDVAVGAKYVTSTKQMIKQDGISKTRLVKDGDFILSNSMSFGRPYIVKINGAIHDGWLLLRINDSNKLSKDYLYYILSSNIVQNQYSKLATGGVVKNLNSDLVKGVIIPIPNLEIQSNIVLQLDKERDIVNANKELITIFDQKIKDRIAKVWGE